MSDQEIISQAVAEIRTWQQDVARQVMEREAAEQRRQAIIKEVMRQTGVEFFDAARFVAYTMKAADEKAETCNHYFYDRT